MSSVFEQLMPAVARVLFAAAGVAEGSEISMHYDSMIAKLIVHGADRNDAIAKMREALNGFVIRGISSNIPFQAALLAHPKFVAGDFNTGFGAEHYGQGFRFLTSDNGSLCVISLLLHSFQSLSSIAQVILSLLQAMHEPALLLARQYINRRLGQTSVPTQFVDQHPGSS